MSDVHGARAEGEAPAVAFVFLLCKEGCSEERAEDVDYCLLLLVDVQPPKEVEDA